VRQRAVIAQPMCGVLNPRRARTWASPVKSASRCYLSAFGCTAAPLKLSFGHMRPAQGLDPTGMKPNGAFEASAILKEKRPRWGRALCAQK